MSTFYDDLVAYLDNNDTASDDVIAAGVQALLANRTTTTTTTMTTSNASTTGEMLGWPKPDTNAYELQKSAGMQFETYAGR